MQARYVSGDRLTQLGNAQVVRIERFTARERGGCLVANERRRDFIGLHAYPEHDDSSKGRDHVDRRLQCRLHADTLEDEVGAAPGQLAHLLGRILDDGIDDLGRAEPPRKLAAPARKLRDDHRRRALRLAP